jgi:hypothetical protein
VSTAEDLTDAGAAATATDFPGLNAACTSLQTDVEAAQAYASVRCRAPQARLAAIKAAADYASELDVYVVHPRPSPASLTRYRRLGAEIVVVDPGRAVVEARCKAQRPWQMGIAVSAWYETATALYQQYRNVDTQGTSNPRHSRHGTRRRGLAQHVTSVVTNSHQAQCIMHVIA